MASRDKVELVGDRAEYLEGIDKDAWAQSVVTEEYNRLRQEVSRDVQAGKKGEAQKKIDSYRSSVSADNAYVGSAAVEDNLKELDDLDAELEEAFQGGTVEQERKRNTLSKSQSAGAWKARRR